MTIDKNAETAVSRRGFVAGAGALTFAFSLGADLAGRMGVADAATGLQLNGWITVGTDNTIVIISPCAEMGQGIHTALPLIAAEELDADWSKVKLEFAPANPKLYGNPHQILNGGMATLASIAVAGYWRPLRLAGAQARRVLLQSVAAEWKVPLNELSTEPSMVVHKASNRRISYGDVAKFAKMPDQPPTIADSDLKSPSAFRLIGRKDIGRVDVPSKVNGTAKYGIDVQVPDMLYAAVLESPMDGAKPGKVDSAEAAKVKGVTRIVPLPFGVAVIGETVEATRVARNALKVEWDTSEAKAAAFDSAKAMDEYARHGRDAKAEVKEAFKRGDAPGALAKATKVVEGAYWSEHASHAQMEPMNCTAKVAEDGKSAELWLGTQAQGLATFVAANVLKTTPDKITLHQQMLGGGFGRRITPDVVAQAVVIANIMKKPVKLILNREDDFAATRPRPMTHHILRAGLDANNNIVGWHHRLVAENVDAVAAPPRFKATGGRDYIGWLGLDQPFYALPNLLADSVRELRGIRVHAWRGIGSGHNKFASESFLDELAAAKKADPLALRLELTKDHPRAHAVLKAVAEMANWGRKREGRGLGIAFSDYHGTYTAGVAEISVNRQSGKIAVHNYWIAIDPGIVVQPDNAIAQAESAVIYGLSSTLLEALTFKNGAPQQSNFHDYPVLRMSDIPDIHVRMIATDNPPTGMGEVGVPTTAPAVGNAFFALTGKRLRHMPMSPARVLEALKA
jgi:isoquinoline 1-oxidoreductase beta subunit